MKKKFNVTGLCMPDRHYMADISKRLEEIKVYVDEGDYFTVNRAIMAASMFGFVKNRDGNVALANMIKINSSLAGI